VFGRSHTRRTGFAKKRLQNAAVNRAFDPGRSVQRIGIDIIHRRRYVCSMKIKTSITLSDEVLEAIDLHIGQYRSRSEFLETAARKFIFQLARKEAEQRDLEIINRRADSLNAEAEDVLTYQVPL
jgi:Arc/MetJ-type ribon-helix-helix transcriptional regulator